jgi:hypothetical protein
MIIMGIRVPKNEAVVYHYYDTDTEYCTIDSMRFGDIQTAVIRRVDRLPLLTLCTSFDAETTIFPGMERTIMDVETGRTAAILQLKDHKETYYNDRYLIGGDERVIRIRDCANPGEPVAVFNLKPLGDQGPSGGIERFVFMCDRDLDERLQMAFLLYPVMRF